jgi:putative nucleotide binding protein
MLLQTQFEHSGEKMEAVEMQREIERKAGREEYAIVLDFLPHGYPFEGRSGQMSMPVAQALGKEHFVLLELVPKKDVGLQPNEEVYIGDGKRDKVHHINGRLSPSRLTATAKAEMEYMVTEIVKKNEKKYLDFFNKAQPLSTRMHSIELIPGMGKKRMWEILEERKLKPFESFANFKKRVKLLPDPEKAIVKRILAEITTEQKHYLFVER